jgi:hypothetical protein
VPPCVLGIMPPPRFRVEIEEAMQQLPTETVTAVLWVGAGIPAMISIEQYPGVRLFRGAFRAGVSGSELFRSAANACSWGLRW